MIRKYFYSLVLILLLASCEESIDREFTNQADQRPAIEAIITNQPMESYVKITREFSHPGYSPEAISGAKVFLTEGYDSIPFTEDILIPGNYYPEPGFRAVINRVYKLFIVFEDFRDSAVSYLLPVTPMNSLNIYEDNSKPGNFYISSAENSDPSMLRYSITEFDSEGKDSITTELREYYLSSYDVQQIFSPAKDSKSFAEGSRIVRRKYSLNPEYESFIRAVLSETDWRGGLFDVQAGTPKGNFTNSGFGFFAGASLVMDTVYLNK
ncbi:MAG: DUF4249 family protein [Bacteroidales bacterium]|nr:DUF4249 family protein [Bacteroidales bacterium]MCB9013919.1 DUF4249 family protein [Bacteroidales bacterium]